MILNLNDLTGLQARKLILSSDDGEIGFCELGILAARFLYLSSILKKIVHVTAERVSQVSIASYLLFTFINRTTMHIICD